MSQRLLLAVADRDVASSAAALAQEGEGLEVVAVVDEPEEVTRALRRHDVDVVVLHDALGATPVLDLARELGQAFPETGLVLIAADDSPDLLRAAMQAGLRDVVSLPLSLEQLESSVRAAAQWSRALRERVTGEESAAGGLGGRLIAVAGAKGGVGTTTVALQLALAATRALPGRPVCVVDFDLQKGDLRAFLDLPHRRSVVDLVEVASEISVRHLQETLYTHGEGFRVLLAPEEGERAEEIGSGVARSVLNAVRARHALTVVDLGAEVSEAGAIAAEIANEVVIVTTPDVVALRGVRRLRELWRRLQVRDDDDVHIVLNRTSRKLEIQPDLARKVVGGRLMKTTLPDDFSAFETAVNTGSPTRVEDGKLRGAYDALAAELGVLPSAEEDDPDGGDGRGLLARLGGERGQSSAEFMGLLPLLIVFVLGLWQIGLIGYTYVLAGHAAQEGARMLAVNPTDGGADDAAYKKVRTRAMGEVPTAWRGRRRGRRAEGAVGRRGEPEGAGRAPGRPLAVLDRLARGDRDRGRGPAAVPGPDAGAGDMRWREERGQASAEFMGMVFWLLLAAVLVWQLMLAAWTANQATNAARTASRVSARADGDPEKAARNAVSGPLRGGLPRLPRERRAGDRPPADPDPAPRPHRGRLHRDPPGDAPELTMGLRDRIASERNGAGGTAPATASPTTASGCSRRSTSPSSRRCRSRSGARGSSAWSAAWSATRARSSAPPSARA